MEVFLSHSAENFDRGESSSVSLISAIVKIWIRGVGVYRFSVENFLYQSAKKFGMGESFSVSLVFGIEKVNYKEGGGYLDFPSKIFCLTVPKISVGVNPLVFQNFRVPKNFMLQWVMSRLSISCRKFFVSQCRNVS